MQSPNRTSPPATYSVDDGDEFPFDTVPDPSDLPTNNTWSMQQLFKIQDYPYGNHSLKVTYKGTDVRSRLTLCNLLVRSGNSTSTIIAPTSTISHTNTPSVTSSNGTTHHNTATARIAGISGTVLVLGLVVILFLLRRRQKGRRRKENPSDENIVPQPFAITPEQEPTSLGPRKARISQHNIENPFMQGIVIAPPALKWTRQATFPAGPLSVRDQNYSTPGPQDDEHSSGPQSRPNPGDTSAAAVNGHQAPGLPATVPNQSVAVVITDPAAVQRVYEEDSGMRIVRQEDSGTVVSVFPPSYTTH